MRHETLLQPKPATALALVVLALAGLMPTILDRESMMPMQHSRRRIATTA